MTLAALGAWQNRPVKANEHHAGPTAQPFISKSHAVQPTSRLTTPGILAGENLFFCVDQFEVNPNGRALEFDQKQPDGHPIRRVWIVVTGTLPSQISGRLVTREAFPKADIWIINPNGVTFGKDSGVEIGGSLFVSTADVVEFANGTRLNLSQPVPISDEPVALRLKAGNNTKIQVHGNLSVSAHQSLTLIANQIEHSGTIEAPAGTVNLIAQSQGSGVRVQGSGIQIENQRAPQVNSELGGALELRGTVDVSATDGIGAGGEVNLISPITDMLGTIQANGFSEGGKVTLTGCKMLWAGQIHADATEGDGGTISIQLTERGIQTDLARGTTLGGQHGNGGTILIQTGFSLSPVPCPLSPGLFLSGSLVVSASHLGQKGGHISLLGNRLDLVDAHLEANGPAGGGIIELGKQNEELRMKNEEFQATSSLRIEINPSSRLLADAVTNGDGGNVRVWSEKETICTALISARGGSHGGNGGSVEVSSRNGVSLNGEVNVKAQSGTNGKFLLDPKNIVVDNASGVFPQFTLVDPNPGGTSASLFVQALSNGNLVVSKPDDNFAASGSGAVYLYNGLTGALISALRGSSANDQVGNGVAELLSNGNFVIRSPFWANGSATQAGAATWGSASTGVSGAVSATNSLIGSTTGDRVGNLTTNLTNENYVVGSPLWDNGSVVDAGAATWGNGTTGTTGVVSATNSLVGSSTSDQVSSRSIFALTNGNYVVDSHLWNNSRGAATWGNGTTGITGVVSAANSLVGSTANDQVGSSFVFALSNGNYVVASPNWANGAATQAGAATWGNGTTGITGLVSAANSLVGGQTGDQVGLLTRSLMNGNYTVSSSRWDNGSTVDAGAVTLGNGTTGTTGLVTSSNSLVGSSPGDLVGSSFILELTNGNFVTRAPFWRNGSVTNAGAVTLVNGVTGLTGPVTPANSLVGTTMNDAVGFSPAVALTNGNYVVASVLWSNGSAADAGAITWGNGVTGVTGPVTATNSLVGITTNDRVGLDGVFALSNGNYVVCSSSWDNGGTVDAGAATWGNGTTGITGPVSPSNSLVGTSPGDQVAKGAPLLLTNGNYVVRSNLWDNASIVDAGAATWVNGLTGLSGPVTTSNSLFGTTANDQVGSNFVQALSNGNFTVVSTLWDNGSAVDAGAVTWGNGTTGITGPVSPANSVVGSTTDDQIGFGSIIALSNGNYVIQGPKWDNGSTVDAGAAIWVNGSTGQTINGINTISAQNSIIGAVPGAAGLVFGFFEDAVNDSFLVSLSNDPPSGRITVGVPNPNQLTYNRGQAATLTITADFLKRTLDAGTDVALQANNDITINSPLSIAAAGGDLTLQAGRSITVNSTLSAVNSDINLLANQPASTGVVNAQRDTGAAIITASAPINLGTGRFTARIDNGSGLTNQTNGAITLSTVTANRITITNNGPTAGAGRVRITGTITGGACNGASLCTAGGGGGQVTINHPNSGVDFLIGDSTTNGTAGTIVTGTVTVAAPFTVMNVPGTFSQGNVSISPGQTLIPPGLQALLMVADTINNRVQQFDGTNWSVIGVGTVGSGNGQFRQPEAVTFDSAGRIFVADTGNDRIQFSTDSGVTWANFATVGSGLNQVRAPQGLALDSDGNLYVSDTGNGRVMRFNGGIPGSSIVIATNGAGGGQVSSPRGLIVDNTFRLFIADESNSRILRILNASTTTSGTSGAIIASQGTALNKVKNPQGVTVDLTTGTLFIADTGNSRILSFPNGNANNASAIALTGSQLGQVNKAEGVTVSFFTAGPFAGNVLLVVGDTFNNRIQGRFLPNGAWSLVGTPNNIGSGIGQFRNPSKIR
ncbi:MAG: filamentous hemagglutinin N-terminal domain-containing protein [Acidobacteria bacterium]|nr:filamentous hemagglutinin N-terminal domain-containing protein [Acidobacteriota bacterium]